jgi:dTDP-4-amino-4,6-dideoxygalactose transaminase
MKSFIAKRKQLSESYKNLLIELPLKFPDPLKDTEYNYSYFPVIFETEEKLIEVKKLLENNNIISRRYFYPSLNDLPQYRGESCPVSEYTSKRALCLPLYYELKEEEVEKISEFIKTCFK